MLKPSKPANENHRIKTLQGLNVLDTPPEERLDRITHFAAKTFNMPIALVSLVDTNRQWFKSCVGLGASETGRDISFCGHAILQSDVFIIEDTFLDVRFADNPLVTDAPNIRFYVGCPLAHENGSRLGTLCMIDRQPRQFSSEDATILKELATLVELELVHQLTTSMDKESGLSNKEGFNILTKISQKVCAKLNLSISVGFLYIKGLLSLEAEKLHYHQVLTTVATTFKKHFRGSDIIARYDQTGFVALVTNADGASTQLLLDNVTDDINHQLAQFDLTHPCEVVAGLKQGTADDDIDQLIFDAFLSLHSEQGE